jgi:hypothetical protein
LKKALPEIPPALPFSKGGELLEDSTEGIGQGLWDAFGRASFPSSFETLRWIKGYIGSWFFLPAQGPFPFQSQGLF